MLTRRVILTTTAILLVGGLAFGAYTSAYAQGGTGGFDPFMCEIAQNCYWTIDVCNPTSGEVEDVGVWLNPENPIWEAALKNSFWGPDHSMCSEGSGMKETGKCKLTEIDAEIYLGTPFEAKWLGSGGYLRFMKPSGEFNYIAKVDVTSGTVMQDGNEYVGQFSARGKVEPGVYTVQCFGAGGTAGLGIQNVEVVGH
jgi:hypothetical protein